MSTADKIAWFEEMVELVVKVGAVDRLAAEQEKYKKQNAVRRIRKAVTP